ncbi:hypothetical protein [Kribbella sp. NPDC050470]|uniref:hypothetical protein n=1 Tax=unclassified Kribbella TaxID=2644121 RepID=UPI00379A2A06
MTDQELRERAKRQRRIWFHRPQMPWRGWASWRLWWRSSDEYGRRTLVIGPDVTGSVVVAYKVCDCEICVISRRQTAHFEAEEAARG